MPIQSPLKRVLARRLNALMDNKPSLGTTIKLAKRSGVSYGTIQRMRTEQDVEISIYKVEALAQAFGLSLAEFVRIDPGLSLAALPEAICPALTEEERVLEHIAGMPCERIMALGLALGFK